MHAADDDSVPVPHDAFRMPRGVLNWRTPFLFLLIALGGVYGVLVMIGRLSPNMASLFSWPANGETLQLPLIAQLASAFAGLAALVLVLSRAVREVDRRPYVAIAPVLAVFAALVHAGLRVDLSALGLSSALVAFAALSVSLLGGALIVREEERTQWVGWGLVLAPCAWLVIVVNIAKGSAPFEPSERAYMAGLFVSTLLMGVAGVAARRLRAGFERVDSDELLSSDDFARVRPEAREQSRDDISEQVTIVAPAFRRPQTRTTRLTMRAARDPSWRGSSNRARTAVMLCAVAVVAYLAVGGLRGGGPTTQTGDQPMAAAPSGPPVVEQLSGAGRKSIDSAVKVSSSVRRDHADKPRASKSSSSHGESLFAASNSGGNSAPARAPTRADKRGSSSSKQARAAAAQRPPAQSAGLPAWGNETLREFGSSAKPAGKPVKGGKFAEPPQVPQAAPPPPPQQQAAVFVPKPMFPTKASKPIEPPKAVEPPKPVKPMTMDQVLDRVEASAKAQRKKAGLGAAKQSKADEELEALISGTMKKKK